MLLDLIRTGDFSQVIPYILSALFVIFVTQPVHEFAHAWAANKLGDPTARHMGRLTLNPMVHINPIGAGMILLFGFGWANPVPVNQLNFRRPKRDMALTALAGPLSNFILAFICLLLANVVAVFSAFMPVVVCYYVVTFFAFAAQINISLAVFNLIPMPPLDGSRILFAVLPDRIYYRLLQYEQMLFMVTLALCCLGAFSGIISDVSYAVFRALEFLAGLPFNLFF
jgi:Zn-dependent protease